MKKSLPADHKERERAIYERARNVIVDAGAGTGKTTLLVARMVHLIAPEDDGPSYPLERIAAITFARKAAGELKLRMRQALLEHSARIGLTPLRRERLTAAIERLDNAPIGTVHSFADRLLRLRPADAHVSPEYEIAEDTEELVWETHAWLLEAAEQGTLAATLAGTPCASMATEVTETLRIFQAAGFRTETLEYESNALVGLDWLVRDLINTRDRDLMVPDLTAPDLARVRTVVDELGRLVSDLTGSSRGTITLRRLLAQASEIANTQDAGEALRRVRAWVAEIKAADLKMGRDFPDDKPGWAAWKWIIAGESGNGKAKRERPNGPLKDDLIDPLMGWMAERLVRLRPVVVERYLQVKRARQALDQVDLLAELRDLLRRNLEARAFYQARFDHLMVDEFQDTDPLQAEILMFLCQDGAHATKLEGLQMAQGKLTIVGDPKQSIYRFRRADIAMYAEVCARVRKSPVCEAQLSVNFRSTPELIEWVNAAFDAVLGEAGSGPLYNRETGAVCNLRLAAGRAEAAGPSVHVMPFGDAELKADESRDLEGQALARYLRWLVEDRQTKILDPRTGLARRPRYGDVAVLTVSTPTVHHLLNELDVVRIPHVVRGGTLFMQDALHQQFLLGLRALSDPNDGAAQVALMRPPFFAVGLDDLVRDRVKPEGSPAPAAVEQVSAIVRALRFARNDRTAGETARALLERTGFGTFVAASENGAQRLARLYELCLALDSRARETGLDFDGITAIARTWLNKPIRLEAPLPVDADAVQVITVHQAKGLEWPIVALWDGRAGWSGFLPQPALSVDAVTGQWALALNGLRHDPSHKALRAREVGLLKEERKRVAYVAATRARDILIVPEAGEPKEASIAGKLLLSTSAQRTHRINAYVGEGPAWWDLKAGVSMRPMAPIRENLETVWAKAAEAALTPRLAPAGVSTVTHSVHVEQPEEQEPAPRQERKSRYGATFGSSVHRALELVLTKCVADAQTAVVRAAQEVGLTTHLEEAAADVTRTLEALESHGLSNGAMELEYPVAGSLEPSTLLLGYIDLLVATEQELVVIDFKTDDPPTGAVAQRYPGYVAQVGAYAQLLEMAGVAAGKKVRKALLFTGDGGVRWV